DRRPRHGAGNKQGRNRDLGPADYGLTDPTLTYRAPMGPQDHDWREYSGPGTGWPGGNGSGPGGDSPGPLRWRPPAAPNGQDPVAAAAVGEPAADPMARGRGTSPGPRRSAGSRSKLGPGPGDDRPGGPGRREHDGPEGGPTWEDDDAGPGSAPHDGGRRARDGSFLPGFADHGGGGEGGRPRRRRGGGRAAPRWGPAGARRIVPAGVRRRRRRRAWQPAQAQAGAVARAADLAHRPGCRGDLRRLVLL